MFYFIAEKQTPLSDSPDGLTSEEGYSTATDTGRPITRSGHPLLSRHKSAENLRKNQAVIALMEQAKSQDQDDDECERPGFHLDEDPDGGPSTPESGSNTELTELTDLNSSPKHANWSAQLKVRAESVASLFQKLSKENLPLSHLQEKPTKTHSLSNIFKKLPSEAQDSDRSLQTSDKDSHNTIPKLATDTR